jgi:integrase
MKSDTREDCGLRVSDTNQPFETEVDAMAKSSVSRRKSKPRKPYPGFPLYAHATGRWAKKIRQKFHYFGKIADDPKGEKALEQLNREWPFLSEGRTPPAVVTGDGCTLRLSCNAFLTAKKSKLDSGELSESSFADYYRVCGVLIDHFGKDWHVDDLRPDDFQSFRRQLAKRLGVVTLRNEINRFRIIFKFADDQRLIDRPVYYGQSFDKPAAKELRRARNQAGPPMFEDDELRKILDAFDPVMRAMVLLGINCGFGNTDCSTLLQSAIDFETGWVDFPRVKTEINRRIPLWPQTIESLREAIAQRPSPKNRADSDLCFVTVQGNRWVRVVQKQSGDQSEVRYVKRDTITSRFSAVLKKLGINGRKGLGFYTIRHTFETIAGESKDQVAVNAIMGHVDNSMAGVYRERISDERLRAVIDVVQHWLFK